MDSDKFLLNYIFIPEVYNMLKEEWNTSNILYSKFIQSKDLGIETNHELLTAEERYGLEVHTDYYKIVDDKKWMINRLKYGF